MSLRDDVDLLRRIPLFSQVSPARLKLLAFANERRSFEDGEVLFREGDFGDDAFVIIDGEAAVLIETPTGPVEVAQVARNALIGEISILCDVPRGATVIARGELNTLRISKDAFFSLLEDSPSLAIEVMRELGRRLVRSTHDLADARAAMTQPSSKTP